jgi:predicted pyridoxine 5'-phosphate oxidase superfamily flavin-nucleotide-binding protein
VPALAAHIDAGKGETQVAIELTEEMKTAINNAVADRAPIMVATVDADGQPNMSFRGSTQAYSASQLSIWIRNQDGGLLKSIAANPQIALMYRNPETRLSFQIHGEAKRDDSEAVRQAVYDAAPEVERNADAERKGTAVIVDVVRVIQRGQIVMER